MTNGSSNTANTIFNGITFAYNSKAIPAPRDAKSLIVIRWKSEKGSNVPARPSVAVFVDAVTIPSAGQLAQFLKSAIHDAQTAIVRAHLDALISGNTSTPLTGVTIPAHLVSAEGIADWHTSVNTSVLEKFSTKVVEDWFAGSLRDNLTLSIIGKMEAAGLDAEKEAKKIDRVVDDVRVNLLKLAGKGTAKSLDDRKIDALCKLVVANVEDVDGDDTGVPQMLIAKMHKEVEARKKVEVDLGEFI